MITDEQLSDLEKFGIGQSQTTIVLKYLPALIERLRSAEEALKLYATEPHSRSEMKRWEIMDRGKRARAHFSKLSGREK